MPGASARAYRFNFPFATLSGYPNGDRNTLVAVPANDVGLAHLTFAPRFEDVESGLAAGGLLSAAVSASAAGAEEEWQVTDADAMLAGLKYYVGTPTRRTRAK